MTLPASDLCLDCGEPLDLMDRCWSCDRAWVWTDTDGDRPKPLPEDT